VGYVVGIDVGSQSVKALLTTEDGAPIATASALCAPRRPADDRAEQDPAAWERAIGQVVLDRFDALGLGGDEVRVVGAGAAADLGQTAETMVRVAEEPVVPDSATAAAYAEAYASYRRLREAVA
jgi:sugar (pentulose or hexulose) kinase